MLTDSFNRRINYLRISVTDLCNLRCNYCMPEEGVKLIDHDDVLSFEEIYEFTKTAVALGIDKVRLTGGEPLVRRDIVSLVVMLGHIPGVKDFAMTTNGTRLEKFAIPLKEAGLHRLNVSLDTMNPGKYSEITRGGDINKVLNGLAAARDAGFEQIKLNCVVKESSEEEDAKSVAEFADKNGYLLRYIRRMCTQTGKFWAVEGGDGGRCEICNRLRLTCDGKVFSCLFDDRYFCVRELGAEQAILKATAAKLRSGHRSGNKFYTIGG